MKTEAERTQAIFHGSTYVATRKGWRKVDRLKPGEEIYTGNDYKPLEQVVIIPNTTFYEASLSDGASLRAAAKQQILINSRGICRTAEVAALLSGDLVYIWPPLPPEVDIVDKPSGLSDQDFGLAVGIFFASKSRSGEALFKRLSQQERNPFRRIDPAVFPWIASKVGDGKRFNLQIPEIWLNGSQEYTSGILDGLFSTLGIINTNMRKPCLRASLSSEKLAYQVRLILLSIGIHSQVSKSQRLRRDQTGRTTRVQQPTYSVSLSGQNLIRFQAKVTLSHAEQNRYLIQAIQNSRNSEEKWTSEVVKARQINSGDGYQLIAVGASDYLTDAGVICARVMYSS